MHNQKNASDIYREILKSKRKNVNDSVWNVFVQILLPLVILLTFVAVQVVRAYKETAVNERQRAERLQRIVSELENTDAGRERKQRQAAYIELQYQKLLRALREVEKEKRREFGLIYFPLHFKITQESLSGLKQSVRLNDDKLSGAYFSNFSTNIFPQLQEFSKEYLTKENFMRALEENIGKEQTTQYGTLIWEHALLSDTNRVRIENSRIRDSDFQQLCQWANTLFNSHGEEEMRTLREDLYQTVLEHAEIEDKYAGIPVIQRSIDDIEETPILDVMLEMITEKNRAKIHNEIVEFVDQLELEVLTLQENVLKSLFQDALLNPRDLDPESQQLIQKILAPESEMSDEQKKEWEQLDDTQRRNRKKAWANEFYRKMTGTWHEQLKEDGYIFLNTLWEKLDAL